MNVKPAPEGFVLHEAQAPQPSAPAAAPPVGSRRAMPPPTIEPSPAEKPDDTIEREWPVVVNLLHKPIRNNTGAEVRQVTMREPRAGDINRYGNPCRINSDGEVLIEERKMTYMIAALTNILPPFIEEMDPRDWNSCAYRIRRFFLPEPAAW